MAMQIIAWRALDALGTYILQSPQSSWPIDSWGQVDK